MSNVIPMRPETPVLGAPLFEEGSIVAMRSGGPPMLVIGYTDDGLVLASWFRRDRKSRSTGEFHPHVLYQVCGHTLDPID